MRKSIDNVRLQALIDKFFAGESTLEEEHALYRYFSRDDIEARWQPYQRMFRNFAALPDHCQPVRKPVQRVGWSRLVLRMAVAAAVACLLLVGGKYVVNLHQEQSLRQVYAGSYVIDNGKRTDRLRRIYPDITQALQQADRIENRLAQTDPIGTAEREVLDNISDPDQRQRVSQMMNPQNDGIQ